MSQSYLIYKYLEEKYNYPTNEIKINQLLAMFKKEENKTMINKMFILTHGVSFTEIVYQAEEYTPSDCDTIPSLKEKVEKLEKEITNLKEDKEELRTNYWNLKQSVNNRLIKFNN